MDRAAVIGGGLVGALWAANLSRRGYSVTLYERRPDLRATDISAGKSINLALSTRGWKALELIGAADAVREIAIPMYGRHIHHQDGSEDFQPYGKEGQAIYSVSRGQLNAILLDQATKVYGVECHFEEKCAAVDFETNRLTLSRADGSSYVRNDFDMIFGTDGAFSQVRDEMQRTRRFNYEQYFIPHGYRELLMPAAAGGGFLMEKHALHIWPRGGFMLIALPNLDGSFTCTLFMPYEGANSFANLQSDEQISSFFARTFPDFTALVPDVVANYKRHPLSDLVIIKCYPWSRGAVLLMGDASHAIVPFYGQGMNSGFEDCSILNALMDEPYASAPELFSRFEQQRKPDADAIAELAMQNYVEMRDLVADPGFVLRKKIEAKLYKDFPQQWMPLYSQVTFSHTRYSEALRSAKIQDRVMNEILALPDIEARWHSEAVLQQALERAAQLRR